MLAHGGGKIINTASMASLVVPHPQKQANLGEFSCESRRILTFISANSLMNLGEFTYESRRIRQAAYNASKSAVVKLTQSLGCEWASRGVNVNCISPGVPLCLAYHCCTGGPAPNCRCNLPESRPSSTVLTGIVLVLLNLQVSSTRR